MGQEMAPVLVYNTERANPVEVIDVKLSLDIGIGMEVGHIGFELYIEGIKTDSFVLSNTIQTGETGRYRYLWDGRDAQGNPLPTGVYEYAVKFSLPYRAQYCYTLGGVFGNPPDCEFGATGVFVDAYKESWVRGTVELDRQSDSSLGAGWVLEGLERLVADEAGNILISDGYGLSEFYLPGLDLRGGLAVESAARPASPEPARAPGTEAGSGEETAAGGHMETAHEAALSPSDVTAGPSSAVALRRR